MLYSNSLLLTYFMYNSLYLLIPYFSLSLPPLSTLLFLCLLGVKTDPTQANGQLPQAAQSMNTALGEDWRHLETTKVRLGVADPLLSDCLL